MTKLDIFEIVFSSGTKEEPLMRLRTKQEMTLSEADSLKKEIEEDIKQAGWFKIIPELMECDINDNEKLGKLFQAIKSNKVKAGRYYMLKDRYINQNKKHFDELCGLYFDDEVDEAKGEK